jgi:hypothetical protein
MLKKPVIGQILFLAFLCCSCGTKLESPEVDQPVEAEPEWIVYEGEVPLDESRSLALEVSLKQGLNVSEGTYTLTETEETENAVSELPHSRGIYTAEFRPDTEDWIIHLHNSALPTGVKRIYRSDHNTIKEEIFRKNDLMLKKQDDDLLLVLNSEKEPITTEADNNLVKRTSRLFTVEGYFVYKGKTAEFYEMNTREKWSVSKRGAFYEAANQYHELAKEKFESLYLKAVAFSIHNPSAKIEDHILVFKRIIQTSSSPVPVE